MRRPTRYTVPYYKLTIADYFPKSLCECTENLALSSRSKKPVLARLMNNLSVISGFWLWLFLLMTPEQQKKKTGNPTPTHLELRAVGSIEVIAGQGTDVLEGAGLHWQ